MPSLAKVQCRIGAMLQAGDVAAGFQMQFGNFRIKGLMLNLSIPLPSPGLFLEEALPSSARPGAALKQPDHEQQHPGVAPGLPDNFGVGVLRGGASGRHRVAEFPRKLQCKGPSCCQRRDVPASCLQPAAFLPAPEKLQAMGNI